MTAGAKRKLASLVLVLVPLALLLVARRLDENFGLIGNYYANTDWLGTPVTRIDRQIVTASLTPVPGSSRTAPFSVQWDGFIQVARSGRYRFQLISDDGSWLEIDGRVAIDNGGGHAPILREQLLDLAAGPHAVRVRFFQGIGGWRIDLLWAPEGKQPQPLTAPSLLNVPMSPWTHAAARALHVTAPYLPFFWLSAFVLFAIDVLWPWFARWHVRSQVHDAWLWSVLLCSTLLNGCGIWWGLRGGRWAADELLPLHVFAGLDLRFSGGWSSHYPPMQFYLLALLYTPFLAAEQILNLQINHLLHFLNRVLSLAMAAGIIVAAYLCAITLKDRVAGRVAAVLTALLLPFVYYAKTGNVDVPYVFWLCWAMLFYARIIVSGDAGSYIGFAVAGTLATATKDQAYGYLVAPAVHIIVLRYVRLLRSSSGRLSDAIRDVVVAKASLAGAATLIIVYNLPFNFSGFARHVSTITGNAGDRYRMFSGTIDGQVELLRHSLGLISFSFGWPAFILVAAALLSTMHGKERRSRLWMLLPVVSYYCTFIAVVSIVFDRFVLGICVLLAIVSGCAIADWMKPGFHVRRTTVLVVLGLVCGYSLARAVSLDAMMMRDSRYYVEDWIAQHVDPVTTVDSAGPEAYLPRVGWSNRIDVDDPGAAPDADYVVISAGHAQRYGPRSTGAEFYNRLTNGPDYSLVLRHQTEMPWSPLSLEPIFADSAESQFTNLDKINPLIEIYRRR